ncbi:CCA tRNA nucleotidyltransferase [Pararhodobacter zhoushanensis]|uniref:CCA tRNA nucleotidyltransferase n=1 Tax=Pararhodobacter zhoushanensis TaxID=2479545 RepID=A0ABT3GUP1_9RHOB|nr:CCA tRNA nucleotidyltransferase [Pararhodobacter zhoushanensis]MCW1931209.1 CCA tRNA nucleotidyltransferase [Pararhodobacter zhoushanensis]
MKISGVWLDNPGTQAVLGMLTGAGYQALAVGGCVRNALLGVPVTDVDIATDALPETVSNLAETAGLRAVPTGIAHGTVTIVAQGEGFEVTSFRHDDESFGRHARVSFGADLAQDAARRDFTMNALYAQADGTVIDPLGGLPDLLARRLRFVGDAEARIHEDYLRVLRFFRFHAQYGDPAQGLDPDALAACAANSAMLETLSRERVTAELRKLLAAADPAPSVAAMAQAGVLNAVLPGADARLLPVLVHLEDGAPGGWLRRLAMLTGDADGLRLSKAETREFGKIRDAFGSMHSPAALGWTLGETLGADAVLGRAALFENHAPEGWHADVKRGAEAQFPLKPADLMPALQGPDLGTAIRQAQAQWLASDLSLGKEALLSRLGLA